MSNRLVLSTALLVVLIAAGGCLIESKVKADGSGEMALKYRLGKNDSVKKQRQSFASPHITIKDLQLDEKTNEVSIQLEFDDMTKLSTAKFFKSLEVTRSDGKDGTKKIEARIVNKRKMNIPENTVEYFGKDVTITVTLPGAIVESNASVVKDDTATWNLLLKDVFEKPEIPLNVTYKAS